MGGHRFDVRPLQGLVNYWQVFFLHFIQPGNSELLQTAQTSFAEMKAALTPAKTKSELKSMYTCTIDQELVVTAAYMVAVVASCLLSWRPSFSREITSWLSSWNYDVKSISVAAYLLDEHSCQISSRSDFERWSLDLFLKRSQQHQENNHRMSSDMTSLHDLKTEI